MKVDVLLGLQWGPMRAILLNSKARNMCSVQSLPAFSSMARSI